jgi:hypothetical protein
MGSFLLTCVTTGLSLSTVWCLSGATPRGQPWTPVMTLPHGRDGLSVQLMVVLWPFRRRSIDRPVHRQFLRNAWLDLITILSATASSTLKVRGGIISQAHRYLGGICSS